MARNQPTQQPEESAQQQQQNEEQVPDPARAYGREKPEYESGMGRLDNNDDAVPEDRDDSIGRAVPNRQNSSQLNAEETEDERGTDDPSRGASDDKEAGAPNMAKTPHYVDPRLRKKDH